jgi:nucleotide-binding universal stress UspA family protein
MKKVLVAVDGSENSKKVAKEAANIAKCMLSEVTVIHIHDDSHKVPINQFEAISSLSDDLLKRIKVEHNEKINESTDEIVNEAAKEFEEKGITPQKVVLKGDPANTICDYAEENGFDMIIVSDTGDRRVEKFLLGGTSEKIVRHAKTSVLVIR